MKTTRSRKFQLLLGALLVLALVLPVVPTNVAFAQSPTITPGYAPYDQELISVRFRSFANTGGEEIYVGVPDLGAPQPRVVRNMTWVAGTNTITIVYDQALASLTATVVNSNGTFSLANTNLVADLAAKGKTHTLADLNIMQITVASRDTGTSAALQNVVLDGASLGSFSGPTPSLLDWMVNGAQLSDGFTLTGNLVLNGTFSGSQENSRVEIKAGYKTLPPSAGLSATDTTICVGEPTTINVNIANVTNLYGYEFKVNYPTTGFTAVGAFVNTPFDTTSAAIVPGWNGTPAGGVVKFAASKQAPAVPVSGSGTVAQVTLNAITAGIYDITLSDVLLGDRDGNKITAEVALDKVTVEVCGLATVKGKVLLQGRGTPPTGTTPPTNGTVTLADAGYGAFSAAFDANGTFTINNVKVAPLGTSYTVTAAHGLYLSNNTRVESLTPGATVTLIETKLKGGDANNDSVIDTADLGCIGGSFGAAPVGCGTTGSGGSSDINADGLVNILDLVLPGGNYGFTTPQGW